MAPSVVEKGTTNGTITDLDGNFTLKVPSDAIINITYVGYQPQSLSVSGQTTFKVKMEEESMALEQVVVTAMGIKKKAASLTYSTQQLGGDELTRQRPQHDCLPLPENRQVCRSARVLPVWEVRPKYLSVVSVRPTKTEITSRCM